MLHRLHLATLLGATAVLQAHVRLRARLTTPEDERRAITHTVRTLGALAWPSVLLSLVAPEDRGCPALAAPAAWPLGVWLVDAYLLAHATPAAEDQVPSLRFDPASVTALSFGLGGMLGARVGSKYVHLFLVAILGCGMLALPSNNLAVGRERALLEAVQRTLVVWCIGLLAAGAALTRACAHEAVAPSLAPAGVAPASAAPAVAPSTARAALLLHQ